MVSKQEKNNQMVQTCVLADIPKFPTTPPLPPVNNLAA